MGRVIALMDDLFFQMKLAETAKHLGIEVKVATTGEALQTLLEPLPKLVVIDLNARSNPIGAIQTTEAIASGSARGGVSLARAARLGRTSASGRRHGSYAPLRIHAESCRDS